MKQNVTRGTWGIRLLIRLFTVVLAVLFFWLLGFVVEDIEAIKGPDFTEIEPRHVDAVLVAKKSASKSKSATWNGQSTTRASSNALWATVRKTFNAPSTSFSNCSGLACRKRLPSPNPKKAIWRRVSNSFSKAEELSRIESEHRGVWSLRKDCIAQEGNKMEQRLYPRQQDRPSRNIRIAWRAIGFGWPSINS